jgi:hypothetical protein
MADGTNNVTGTRFMDFLLVVLVFMGCAKTTRDQRASGPFSIRTDPDLR